MAQVNTSTVPDDETASTDPECAAQRAANLASLGVRSVLELCAGPSLRALETAYHRHGIHVVGNDIDPRWVEYYPKGRWIIGDAFSIVPDGFDAIVFAPPLTRGCTGRREDSLCVDEVRPKYRDFTKSFNLFTGVRVYVLPARSLATSDDRRQLFSLTSSIPGCDVIPLIAGRRKIRKYVDVYCL